MTTSLLVLTLNEIVGMKAIMPTINRTDFDQILVIDGGSTDGTVEWALANGYEVHQQKRKGIRHGYLEALPLMRGEILLSFSPDGNCPVEALPQLIEAVRQGNDLAIASRYKGDAVSDDDDWITAFGNWLFTRTVNALHGGRYTDVMTIYRAFKKQTVYDLDLHLEASYHWSEKLFATVISWEPLMSVRAAKAGLKISEVAADEPARIGGVRKLQILRWGAAYYFQFWHELYHWPVRKNPHPLK